MAERKFRFVSPGIFINEVDNSQLPNDLPDVGPIIIGRAAHGPAMRPIRISSPSEFIEFYGNPIPGGSGTDVWRDGNRVGPTYGPYAAMAYLRAGVGPVNYVRLLGTQSPTATSGEEAGWMAGDATPSATHASNDGAFGLFLFPSGAAATYTNGDDVGDPKKADIGNGRLAAVFYSTDGVYFELSGANIAGTNDKGSLALIKSTAEGPEFKLSVTGSTNVDYTTSFNFDRNSSKYIRKVFNTNPQLSNGRDTTHTDTGEVRNLGSDYFLGETFDRFAVTDPSLTGHAFGIIVPLGKDATADDNYSYKRRGFSDGQTGLVFSQNTATSYSGFDATQHTQNLFKFRALNHAAWASKNLKVSITDVKASKNDVNSYGSFTVQIRLASDSDNAPQIVEQFTGCNLNPASENYVAKKIGDKYVEFDTTQRRLRQYGEFSNQSKYIYIIMENIVADGNADPSLLPFGFYGPPKPNDFSVASGSLHTFASGTVVAPDGLGTAITTFATGAATLIVDANRREEGAKAMRPDGFTQDGPNTFLATPAGTTKLTASFLFPSIPLRTNAIDGGLSDPTKAYFGIQPTINSTSTRFDPGYADYVRPAPGASDTFLAGGAFANSFVFTMDDIVGTAGTYTSGSAVGGTSLNAAGNSYTASLDSGFNRFTMPLWGGHDGVDIGEQEPFNNQAIQTSPTEQSSYAYYTVKRAIDSVADPEVVEANIISAPGITQPIITDQLLSVAENRADCLAVIDIENVYTPKTESTQSYKERLGTVASAVSSLENRRVNTSYGCTFYPWVRIRDDISNSSLWAPPSVTAIGTFASSEARSELWFAPAGFTRGGLSTGAGGFPVLSTTERLRREDRDDLYEVNINPIATFPSEGIVIFGQKTLQVTPSALDRINVRRLLIFLKKRISRIAAGILFDQNVQTTWLRFKTEADKFLGSVQSRLGLTEFRVVLDESTTTPDLVDRNILYAKIFLKPARAIEFIAIDFVITRTGASFDD
jgi:hypothetical protein